MKKAAKKKVSRTSKVKSKNSLLLVAILILAVVVFVVWAVIAKSPGKTPHAQVAPGSPAPPSLTFNWNYPIGVVAFTDLGGKKGSCQSNDLTCSAFPSTFKPGSTVNYHVNVNGPDGPILTNGTTIASPDGSAIAKWSWRYEVNFFEYSFASCAAAGSKCIKGALVNNTNTYLATNLLYSTDYTLNICAPDCAAGILYRSMYARTIDSPFPPSCSFSPSMSKPNQYVTVTSQGGLAGSIMIQGALLPNAVKVGDLVAGSSAKVMIPNGSIPGLYAVRVSGFGVLCKGAAGEDLSISANTCDFNRDGYVNQADVTIASKGFGKVTTSLNQPYDVNKDGWVNSLDLMIISKNNPTYCN